MEQISFQLHALGWKSFQNLCLSIASEIFGQTVQGFFDSHDGGRDGAFYGTWKPSAAEELSGSFTVQCKFTSKPDTQLSSSDLSGEIAKAERLAKNGLADNYIVMTNARVTGTTDEKVRAQFEKMPGLRRCLIFGHERISQFIRESSRLRMMVPRVYGLGDLSLILDERAQAQAIEILSSLGGDLDKFVMTGAHQRSARAIIEHGFVLLLGEPACGKSTIAAALSMAALDEWGCTTIKARDANDFVDHWNPNDSKQFFWIDDAFGATQLDYSSISSWNKTLPHLQAAIKKGARILLTSRDYIYKSARDHLKETAFPLLKESQVVINVQEITTEERQQILYNHIRLGSQPKPFKARIKPHLPKVAESRRFSPEVARRLGDPIFTKNIQPTENEVLKFTDAPEGFLKEIIQTLDTGGKSALAMTFMRGGALESPVSLNAEEERALTLLGGDISQVRSALNSLDGSMVLKTSSNGSTMWKFKHPTIRDAFASLISEDAELLDIYLTGTPLVTLFREVSCGDLGIKGARVIVPVNRYPSIIVRIQPMSTANDDYVRSLHWFLATRCDKAFLIQFLESAPNFINTLHVYSYLYAVSDIDVLVRLCEFGLLPEDKRHAVVERIKELAVETPDAGFLHHDLDPLLTESDRWSILGEVETKLIPNLSNHVDDFRYNWNGKEDPETTFSELTSALERYKEQFTDDEGIVSALDSALSCIASYIDEMNSELPVEPDWDDDYRSSSHHEPSDDRSIFDDVDH